MRSKEREEKIVSIYCSLLFGVFRGVLFIPGFFFPGVSGTFLPHAVEKQQKIPGIPK